MVPTPQRSSAAAGWLQLSGSSPIWSPDGAHFASRYDSGVVVYDASGGEGSEAPALSWPSWLDNSYLVGISKIDGWRQVVVFDIETGESVVIRPPHEVDYAVGNGQGAVALSWHRDDDWPDTHYNYVVWQDDDFTHPRDGFAQAWSPDGSTLALYHQYAPIREPNGWVSLVAWPNLDELYSDGPPSAAGDILFDPTSRHVAYDTQLAESAAGPFVARLVNLDARSNIDLPRDITGGAMWLTDGLAIVRDDLSIQVYSPTGERLETEKAPALAAAASRDGSTISFWSADEASHRFWVRRDGETTAFRAPFALIGVSLAPDGSYVVVGSADGGSYLRVL